MTSLTQLIRRLTTTQLSKRSQVALISPSNLTAIIFLFCLTFKSMMAQAFENEVYKIYLDADQTNNQKSGQSILLGIKAALHESNGLLGNYPVEVVVKDHKGNTRRSQYHLEQFISDERALAVFGGLHSPPLIQYRDFINDNKILTLVPWAAATPITRAKDDNNWIFRLSIDDSKAGKTIVKDLIENSNYRAPYLFLEDSGWGRANEITITRALFESNLKMSGQHYFHWGVSEIEAKAAIIKAIFKGADSVIFVGNAPEGIKFAKAMLSLPVKNHLSIRSHWGITGGNFTKILGLNAIKQLDLSFIQTSFSFFQSPLSDIAKQALRSASIVKKVNSISPADIEAPTGFIHAYDLTKLLISAAKQLKLSGNVQKDRRLIKNKLENLSSPVEGLIKTYITPFDRYQLDKKDAHEALGQNDFAMAHYDENGNIRINH